MIFMPDLTTSEVRRLLEKHGLLQPYPVRERERYLPRPDQLKVNITFLRAVERCESAGETVLYRGVRISKFAMCIADEVQRLHPETELWSVRNKEDFEEIYRRVAWR
jgi:hypothetical protein